MDNAFIIQTPEQEIFYRGHLTFKNENYLNQTYYEVQYYFSEDETFPTSFSPKEPSKRKIPSFSFIPFLPNRSSTLTVIDDREFIEGIDLGSLTSSEGYFREIKNHLNLSIFIDSGVDGQSRITFPLEVTTLTKE